jgi:hypothetical protein
MMRSYSSRPCRLIDAFVKTLCLGLEEMICCGMINLAAVGEGNGGSQKEEWASWHQMIQSQRVMLRASPTQPPPPPSFQFQTWTELQVEYMCGYFWIPDQSWCNWHKSCRSRWRWYLIHNSWRLGSSITHVSLGGEHWSWRAALLHHLLIVNALRVVALPVLF